MKAADAAIASRIRMTRQANKTRRPDSPQFQQGERVYVDSTGLGFDAQVTRRFLPRFIGPYKIILAVPETSTYEIAFPSHFKIHKRVHADKLRNRQRDLVRSDESGKESPGNLSVEA